MKRLAVVMGLVVFLAAVLAAGVPFVTQAGQKGGAAAPLCDLTIEKIYLTKECMVAVVVKNLGPGPVPDQVWTVHTPKSAGVYLYKNGAGWGGGTIWGFDPAKNLKNPGDTATYVSTLKVTGAAGIKAVVDLWNVVPEGANEGNNSLETKLACGTQPGPCCIAGAYDGTYADKPSATCKKPGTGKFTLDIKQQANCGGTVEGKVVNTANNNTHYLTGTVTPSGKCCKLEGELKGAAGTPTAGEVIKIKAILCKKGDKWFSTDGTYTNLAGCSGQFTLKQK